MTDSNDDDPLYVCSFCGVTNREDVIDCFIAGPNDITICNKCVRHAEAILAERDVDYITADRLPGTPETNIRKKLRPITRMPKSWVICDSDLYKIQPTVTAFTEDGEKSEKFSIPKPLAVWIISKSEKFELERAKNEIKREILDKVRKAILPL